MLSLKYENINYVMTQILKLSYVSFSYVNISYVLASPFSKGKKRFFIDDLHETTPHSLPSKLGRGMYLSCIKASLDIYLLT